MKKYEFKIVNEFKSFISRGNVVDMAVGVIVGAAFGKIVTSLVNDILMPLIGIILGVVIAVIKDNNVDMVIIAVKSRMDSNILTDLAKGIPLGVKVWRMPTFYAHITQKIFTNKMAVNWLFYDYVRPKHILYSRLKKVMMS